MQNAVGGSYLASLSEDDLSRLAMRLSPDVRQALEAHMSRIRSSPPPSPRPSIPKPTLMVSDQLPPPRESPLFSARDLKTMIPAVAPDARHWLREADASARTAARQQRTLHEMGRQMVRTEEARDAAEARAVQLQRISEQQRAALLASAARASHLREGYQRERDERLREADRSRQLERALRAVIRERRAAPTSRPEARPHVPAIAQPAEIRGTRS